jgi:CubicO group peptidase (beta-lactamase class C family)
MRMKAGAWVLAVGTLVAGATARAAESGYALWEVAIDANTGQARGEPRRLTLDPDIGGHYFLSMDGRRLAFVSTSRGTADLWIQDETTGKAARLTTAATVWSYPVIAPDGRSVFFQSSESDGAEFIASVATGGGATEKWCASCSWPTGVSPDGRWLLHQHGLGNPGQLEVLDLSTGQKAAILQDPELVLYRGHFSPDGRWIVFHSAKESSSGGNRTVEYVAPFRGTTPVPRKDWIALTDGTKSTDAAAWSPDGNRVYYVSDHDAFRCIWTQLLDPATKKPVGAATVAVHLHDAKHPLKESPPRWLDLAIGRDRLIFSVGAPQQESPTAGTPSNTTPVPVAAAPATDATRRMEQVIQSYVAEKKYMGSVLVARDGHILLSAGYGFANMEWQVPNTPATKFRLGSVTKQFTAAAILLLEERGKLTLDDPIKKFMPDAPPAWDKITLRHLLSHTAGLPNFTNLVNHSSETATVPREVIWRFRDLPLEFEPGEKWSYSNSGYILLGYVVEKASGQNYADFVRENIFTPLDMKDSGYDSSASIIPQRASGYRAGESRLFSVEPDWSRTLNAAFVDMSTPFAAGGLYSTTEDLLRWQQGLFGGKLLSAASLTKMTTPVKQDYALGVAVFTAGTRKRISHGGAIDGFNTTLDYYPDEKLVVAVLANLNGNASAEIASKLAPLTWGEEVVLPSERKEVAVAPAVLAGYTGTYELAPQFSITITNDGAHLLAQGTNQPKFPLIATAENRFFLKVAEAEIEFVKDAQGQVTHLVLHQGGQDVKGIRK